MSRSMEGVVSVNGLQKHMDVSDAVIFAVADAEDVSPLELTPLTNAIDPDALNDFIVSLNTKQDTPTGFIEFEYRGHSITISADGTITVGDTNVR